MEANSADLLATKRCAKSLSCFDVSFSLLATQGSDAPEPAGMPCHSRNAGHRFTPCTDVGSHQKQSVLKCFEAWTPNLPSRCVPATASLDRTPILLSDITPILLPIFTLLDHAAPTFLSSLCFPRPHSPVRSRRRCRNLQWCSQAGLPLISSALYNGPD